MGAIRNDLGVSAATVGLLTSLPVLCMALLGVVAHRLAERFGRGATTLVAIACVAAGNGLRVAGDDAAALFGATLLAGVGVAACGVMLPGIVKASFPRRTGAATAVCSAAMLGGAAAAGALAVPLGSLLGSWEASLGFWALPALPAVAAYGWIAARGRTLAVHDAGRGAALARAGGDVAPAAACPAHGLPWRAPAAWLLGAFFALQSTLGYAYLAWLPAAYEARGWSEAAGGGLAGLLQLAQLATALLLPLLATRRGDDRRPVLLASVALTVTAAVWLVALPDVLPWAATTLVGLGLGGGFSLTMLVIVDYTTDATASTGLAAMTFLVGYSVAALAPIGVGALHDGSGGYGLPFAALALVALAQLATATRLGPQHNDAVGQPAAASATANRAVV